MESNGHGQTSPSGAGTHLKEPHAAFREAQPMKAHPEVPVVRKSCTDQVRRFQGLLILHVAYIAIVAGLFAASETRDGLWKVKDWDYVKETEGSFMDRSLWWTAVPAFFFSILGLYMRRCYGDILDLEPYLGAYKGTAPGRSSVLVDYRRDLPPKAALNAWRNKHWLSSLAILLTTFFSIIIIPLSSHLLETKLHQEKQEETALQRTSINLGRLNENAHFSRAFEITSALEVYGSGGNVFSQWMDSDHTFPSFIAQNATWEFNTTVEIPRVPGYYAYLANCSFLEIDDYEVRAIGGGGNTTDATLRVTTTQDGCEMEHDLEVEGSDFDMYFSTGAAECSTPSETGGNITSTRLLFLLAWPRPGQQEKLALATQLAICSPVFGVDVGTLKVSALGRVSVSSFAANDCTSSDGEDCNGYSPPDGTREDFRAVSKAILEHKPAEAVANTKTNSFGKLILDRFDVTRRDQSAPLSEAWPTEQEDLRSDMLDSIGSIYKTLFLTASLTMAFEAAGWPLDFRNTTVLVATDIEKLFAVGWVSCLVLAVLGFSFLVALWGYRMSHEMRKWDVDLPSNVICSLGLVCDSGELMAMARDVKENGLANSEMTGFHKPFRELAKERWNCEDAIFEVEARGTLRSLRARNLARL